MGGGGGGWGEGGVRGGTPGVHIPVKPYFYIVIIIIILLYYNIRPEEMTLNSPPHAV